MKNFLLFLSLILLIFAGIACGDNKNEAPSSTSKQDQQSDLDSLKQENHNLQSLLNQSNNTISELKYRIPSILYEDAIQFYNTENDASGALALLKILIDSLSSNYYTRKAIRFRDSIILEENKQLRKIKNQINDLNTLESLSLVSDFWNDEKKYIDVRRDAFSFQRKLEKQLFCDLIKQYLPELPNNYLIQLSSILEDTTIIFTKDARGLLNYELEVNNKYVLSPFESKNLSRLYAVENPIRVTDNFNNRTMNIYGKVAGFGESDISDLLSFFSKLLGRKVHAGGAFVFLEGYGSSRIITYIYDRQKVGNLNIGEQVNIQGVYSQLLPKNRLTIEAIEKYMSFDIKKFFPSYTENDLFLIGCQILDNKFKFTSEAHLNKIRLIYHESENKLSEQAIKQNLKEVYCLEQDSLTEELFDYLLCNGLIPYLHFNDNCVNKERPKFSIFGKWQSTSGNQFEVYKKDGNIMYRNLELEWEAIIQETNPNTYIPISYSDGDKFRGEFITNFVSDSYAIFSYQNGQNFNIWSRIK